MSEKEVKKAIEMRKLPLGIIDRIAIVCYVALLIVGVLYSCQNNQSIPISLMIILFIGGFCSFLIYSIFQTKKLFGYSSTLLTERKKYILEKLVDNPDIYCSDEFREDNYYRFSERTFSITVIYDDSGYYVNSTHSSGRVEELASPKMTEIIRRIKKLEAEA